MTVGVYGVVAMGALAFALQLPVHSPVAREMIVAHQIAGGAPAQEMTALPSARTGEAPAFFLVSPCSVMGMLSD
jgi:hypothetical protein